MSVFIHHIETHVPPFECDQEHIGRKIEGWLREPQMRRVARHIFRNSGIRTRYSALPDFAGDGDPVLFRTAADGSLVEPGTEARNRVYTRECGRMAVEVAARAVERAAGFEAPDITHVITVSCTGFYAPGADLQIVSALGLPGSTERYHVGFMGCYGAFPALRMARQFCEARPDAVVLVVDLELCSLHLQVRPTPDSILANTLFADGAAAVLVSARRPSPGRPAIALGRFLSAVVPEGRGEMAWDIGDSGFNMILSSYIPELIRANLGDAVAGLLGDGGFGVGDVDLWAIHPGGRSILDKAEAALQLPGDSLRVSRDTLADYGNMSSVTVLFVLEKMMRQAPAHRARICAMGFGPGLVIESFLGELLPESGIPAATESAGRRVTCAAVS